MAIAADVGSCVITQRTNKQNTNNGEFDSGSGGTLAIGLTHASRGAARCSNTSSATGEWVSNTYATYLLEVNNPMKVGLIHHILLGSHELRRKDLSLRDRPAFH